MTINKISLVSTNTLTHTRNAWICSLGISCVCLTSTSILPAPPDSGSSLREQKGGSESYPFPTSRRTACCWELWGRMTGTGPSSCTLREEPSFPGKPSSTTPAPRLDTRAWPGTWVSWVGAKSCSASLFPVRTRGAERRLTALFPSSLKGAAAADEILFYY